MAFSSLNELLTRATTEQKKFTKLCSKQKKIKQVKLVRNL